MILPEGVLERDGDLVLTATATRPAWAAAWIGGVRWGGQRPYRFRDPQTVVAAFPHGTWLVLTESDEPRALYQLVGQRVRWAGEDVVGVYRALLAVDPAHRGRGLGRFVVGCALERLCRHVGRGVVYGVVDPDNAPIVAVGRRVGFEPVAELSLVSYARGRPRPAPGLRRAGDEREAWARRLRTLWGGHDLFELDSLDPTQGWVLERDGAWAAAVQAEPRALEIGRSVQRVLWMQHLWFDDPAAGHDVIEGVLHATDHRFATLAFDPRCPVLRALTDAGSIGPLAGFGHRIALTAARMGVGPVSGPVVATFRGV